MRITGGFSYQKLPPPQKKMVERGMNKHFHIFLFPLVASSLFSPKLTTLSEHYINYEAEASLDAMYVSSFPQHSKVQGGEAAI